MQKITFSLFVVCLLFAGCASNRNNGCGTVGVRNAYVESGTTAGAIESGINTVDSGTRELENNINEITSDNQSTIESNKNALDSISAAEAINNRIRIIIRAIRARSGGEGSGSEGEN